MFLKKIIGALAAGTLFALSLAAAPQNENFATMNTPITYNSAFPLGEENVAYAQFFTGKSWLARLTKNAALNAPIANVTFAPGCRNNWHSHTGGQILIATDGVGFYQKKVCRRGGSFPETLSKSRRTSCIGTAPHRAPTFRILRSSAIRRPTKIRGSNP